MKNIGQLAVMLLCTAWLFTACTSDGEQTANDNKEVKSSTKKADKKTSPTASAVEMNGKVNWITMEELPAAMEKQPKKVLVDLYTSWCGWCKRMDKNTFSYPEISEYINENFHAVKFNAEQQENINFSGKEYKFVPKGRRGTNELTYKLILGDKPTGRVGYPTVAFLDEKLKRIDAYAGYKDANGFDGITRFIAENHYSSMTLPQFLQDYQSPIPQSPPKGNRKMNQKDLKKLMEQRKAQAKGNSNP
ncbi:MAG: thioredoxin family protein [Chitinophagales bacterium]